MNSAYSKTVNPEIQKPKKKKRSPFSKFILNIMFLILFFAALGLGAGFGGLLFYFSKSIKTNNMSIISERSVELGSAGFITLPDFTGAWYITVEKILREFGLDYEHSFQTGGRFYGTVLSTIPNAGSTFSKNAVIKLFVDDTKIDAVETIKQETDVGTSTDESIYETMEDSPTIEVLPPENLTTPETTNENHSPEEGF